MFVCISFYKTSYPIDKVISDFFYVDETDQGIGHTIMGIVTYLGKPIVYIALLVILYYVWDKRKAYKTIATLVSSMTINVISKAAFRFDRPDDSFGYASAILIFKKSL